MDANGQLDIYDVLEEEDESEAIEINLEAARQRAQELVEQFRERHDV